jgi:hypothetical protein
MPHRDRATPVRSARAVRDEDAVTRDLDGQRVGRQHARVQLEAKLERTSALRVRRVDVHTRCPTMSYPSGGLAGGSVSADRDRAGVR